MDDLLAFVSWPSAPLTKRLVHYALNSRTPAASIQDTQPQQDALPAHYLQWASYDELNHDLTFAHRPGSKILSSSYVIRKALIRKHFLSRCIRNYTTKHPNSLLKNGVPKTWELELSFADELDELWGDDLYDLSDEIDEGNPLKWWILKPGMADRGMGLRLFNTKQDLEAIFQEFEGGSEDEEEETPADSDHEEVRNTAVVTSQLRHFVIQEYLMKPLLMDPSEVPLDNVLRTPVVNLRGHKFHLRVYCVASGALKVYMYERILALFSSVPFTAPSNETSDGTGASMDLAAHLTNTSLQTDRGEAGVRLLDELVGCHILSSPQRARRRAMGMIMDAETIHASRQQQAEIQYPKLSLEDVAELKNRICEILAETFKAAVDMSVHFQPLPNAFELYGIDFVVTDDGPTSAGKKFGVNLLEVNAEPAIELTGPRLTWILEDLFKSIGKTCVQPFFVPATSRCPEAAGWDVGEAREHLRKCLDMPIRAAW